jgi:Holliday junction resolvase RusA-like endonuclease
MNNILYITIPGKPIAKQRSRKGAYGNWYNPQEKEMNIVKNNIKNQLPDNFKIIKKGTPVILNITWFFEPIKNEKTKKLLDLIKNEDYPYCKKIDRDNADKWVMDCFSKIIFDDDNQVYGGTLFKFYTPHNARTYIEVCW